MHWSADGYPFGESHKTEPPADRFRAKLVGAVDKGESFDTVTGLPDSRGCLQLPRKSHGIGYVAYQSAEQDQVKAEERAAAGAGG
ncbi:hypothetical protein GCM10010211_03540 [Streptomyces albospinus]|uniref:Uncharacterized protein n=1 Tax=Streptomyces albospinus TaxID=285515 RepID=A0ABQ2UPD7_9ACTN|nr:hypothetical protein GCM10010211_03540 [Streptomyces albospinus]